MTQKMINGGKTIAIVNCKNGYDFCVNPDGMFNPHEICAAYGGYSHMTYEEIE